MTKRKSPSMTVELISSLEELESALKFFDKVRQASIDEQIAVSSDHWDWLESAARQVVEALHVIGQPY